MVSLEKLQMKKMDNLFKTTENVRSLRESLENSTREAFEKIRRARMMAWQMSRFILLD